MIPGGELRRQTSTWSVDIIVAERHYVLSQVLAALYPRPMLAKQLVFRGGTAPRKCSFTTPRQRGSLEGTTSSLPWKQPSAIGHP